MATDVATENPRDYAVGYRRPPRERQFRKGQSGNPSGRPEGALGLRAMLNRELKQWVTVNEGGKRRRMTKYEVLCRQLVNKALTGHERSVKLIAQLVPELGAEGNGDGAIVINIVGDDAKLL
jgi:hypothetical protein